MGVFLIALALSSCADDSVREEEGDDVDLVEMGSSNQALSSSGAYQFGTTTSAYVDLGTAQGRTCFLAGVAGSLVPKGGNGSGRRAGVRQLGSRFQLFLEGYETGPAYGAFVRCINSDKNRTYDTPWSAGDGPRVLAPYTADRHCFLTSIESRATATQPGGFAKSTDNVRVYNDGKYWYLTGSQSGFAQATATCVDTGLSQGFAIWQAGDPGARKDYLLTNPGGTECMLTSIGGHFTADDYEDGVSISYEQSSKKFYLNTSNGKTGHVQCVN